MTNRKKSPPRKSKPRSYCFIVEGCTEYNYIQCLKKFYKSQKAIETKKGTGGGAKAVLCKANKLIGKYKEDYLGFVIWFDKDTCSSDRKEVEIKQTLKKQENVDIFTSDPCVEHWLLAHFQEINLDENQKCDHYENKLKDHIKNYEKNNCRQLEKYLDPAKINIAIHNYPEIGAFCQKYFLDLIC